MKLYSKLTNNLIGAFKKSSANYDIFFISYPKSGRTWVRSFLNHYYFNCYPLSVIDKYNTKYDLIPNINFYHGKHGKHSDMKRSNINAEALKFYSKKTILLLRDPRDVYVSYYFHRTKRKQYEWNKKINWENVTIEELLKDEVFGIKSIIKYMNIWYERLKSSENCIFLFYEDLIKDPYIIFKDLIIFINEDRPCNEKALEKSIEQNTFFAMRNREKNKISNENELLPINKNDEESFKARKGIVGNYLEYFTNEDLKFIEKEFSALNENLKKKFKV